ncbi:MAG: chemotaxis protein CheA, partial [Actinomycetota bacterium]|nr:chemotaxis protein CheA [Actinomycetota bacterium]
SPTSTELLGSIFRTIHTIKGTSSFLDFHELERLAHAGENLLSLLRDGQLTLDAQMTTTLLEMVDALRATLAAIQATRTDAEQDHARLVKRLEAHATSDDSPVAEDSTDEETAVAESLFEETTAEDSTSGEDVVEDRESARAAATPPPEGANAEDSKEKAAAAGRSAADSSIRVDVDLLDRLMDLVSELVLARNQIRQYRIDGVDPAYDNATQQLDLLTSDLQQAVMATRMQPLSHLFGRLPRMVRDIANTCDKQVKLQVTGGDTELDRTLLEAIRDPLTHIVRNSVDHGIENSQERLDAGKPEHGTIWIDARHEGGQVMIEITDDGKGFDLDRIIEKAVSAGVVTAEAASTMGEREIAQLVFHPGLSTAEAVTTVSGRGVGMDVVKRSIDEIGGTIDIETTMGSGTKLTLRIPLTLAIIPALRCTCGGQRYLIPQLNVVELHQLDDTSRVEHIGNTPVFRLRGELLPLLHWRDVLDGHRGREGFDISGFIVVIHAHGLNFGFVVDEVVSTEEIVVKPLRAHVKEIDAFAGSTVLGDGSVALIFDPIGLTSASGLTIDSSADTTADPATAKSGNSDTETLLVCDVGDRRVAFALGDIVRLESVRCDSLDQAAGQQVVQYRGALMRIVEPQNYLPGLPYSECTDDPLSVLVLRGNPGSDPLGVVVDHIREVHEVDLTGGRPADTPIRLSIPIDGQVTDVID